MKRIWKIDVPGRNGYSFAVRTDIEDEQAVISAAEEAGLFESGEDANFAMAEDITNSSYDLGAFKDCITDLDDKLSGSIKEDKAILL